MFSPSFVTLPRKKFLWILLRCCDSNWWLNARLQNNGLDLLPNHGNLLYHIDGLMQDCSISIANTLEIVQSFTNPSIFAFSSRIIFMSVFGFTTGPRCAARNITTCTYFSIQMAFFLSSLPFSIDVTLTLWSQSWTLLTEGSWYFKKFSFYSICSLLLKLLDFVKVWYIILAVVSAL